MTGHHSATHLLNAGLRKILGSHILQTGSLVSADYLRFDFSHGEKIQADKLREIELHVNQSIAQKADVTAKLMGIDEAKKRRSSCNLWRKIRHRSAGNLHGK